MKKNILASIAIVATLSLSSCGMTHTTSNNINQTQVMLKEKNFRVLGQVYGEVKATYILGLGGIRRRALRANAIDEMTRNAQLTGSQTLVNVTTHTSWKGIFPFFYQQVVCDATATVIEFVDTEDGEK